MKRKRIVVVGLGVMLLLAVLSRIGTAEAAGQHNSAWEWQLVSRFPRPRVLEDNPMSTAKVELGRHLFYDKRLSGNLTQSCASCHKQELAFTDGLPRSVGSTGETHPRSSMSLANVAYTPLLTWANPKLDRLENQALVPMLGTDPVELGLHGREQELIRRLQDEPVYRRLFSEAYPDDGISLSTITGALAAFQRSIVSFRSPYDRFRYSREENAISEAAKRGMILFFSSSKGGCFQCHGGLTFSGPVQAEGLDNAQVEFHNTGIYYLQSGETSYPKPNTGIHAHTGKPEDMGKFRAPTLRNIALTAPYMHDGSMATLDEVLSHYAAGGRTANPNKSRILRPFELTVAERRDLIAFLESLTDEELLTDPRWSNPWVVSDVDNGSRPSTPSRARPE